VEVPEKRDLARIITAVEGVFHGKREVVRLALAALIARGHVLFEDIPGVGKTTLARALARALGLTFRRIQFTSDLLPSDILGVTIFNPRTTEFETRPGPLFTNIVVADEINRAPPRTQSGLLEAMQEGRVTIDEQTFELPRPFLVMATQNPLEHHGTYPLPESQLDRFLMRLTIGYPDSAAEKRILAESVGEEDRVDLLQPVLSMPALLALQSAVERVHVDDGVVEYLMALITATRSHPQLRLGASPRAAIGLFRAARALALVEGRDYVVPDDVSRLAVPGLAHRVLPHGRASASAETHDEGAAVIEEILRDTPVPVGAASRWHELAAGAPPAPEIAARGHAATAPPSAPAPRRRIPDRRRAQPGSGHPKHGEQPALPAGGIAARIDYPERLALRARSFRNPREQASTVRGYCRTATAHPVLGGEPQAAPGQRRTGIA